MGFSRKLADSALEVIGTDLGSGNVGFGLAALDSVAAGGGYNTALGDSALTAVAAGDNNVGIGYQAGLAITTGTDNVAIGYQSNKTASTGSCFILRLVQLLVMH